MKTFIGSWIRIECRPENDTLVYMPIENDLGLTKFYYLDLDSKNIVRSDIYGKEWEQLTSYGHKERNEILRTKETTG